MKLFRLSLLFLTGIAAAIFTGMKPAPGPGNSGAQPLGEYLYTVPVRKQQLLVNAQSAWWHEYLEYSMNLRLFQPLLDRIVKGEIKVFSPVYPFREELSSAEMKRRMFPVDSLLIEEPEGGGYYLADTQQVTHEDIISVTFHEDWTYDAENLSLQKKVKGIVLHVIDHEDLMENVLVSRPLFYIPFNSVADRGEPQVQGITYDLNLDTVPFDRYIRYAVTGFADNAKVEQERVGVRMMIGSLTAAAGKKGAKLYDTLYPYNRLLDKNASRARQPLLARADNLRFLEDWTIDAEHLSFVKNVRGVVLTDLFLDVISRRDQDSTMERRFTRCAFFPMNGNAPMELRPGVVRIDSFATTQLFGWQVPFPDAHPMENADTAKLVAMSSAIARKVRNGTLTAYGASFRPEADDPFGVREPLTQEQVANIFTRRDSIEVFHDDYSTSLEVLITELDSNDYHGYNFYETWAFDPVAKTFTKSVKAMGLLQYKFDYGGDIRAAYPVFNVDLAPVNDPAAILKPEFLVSKGIRSTCRVDWCEQEGASSYADNSGNPLIDYSGTYLENIDPSRRYQFVAWTLQLIEAGRLAAYDAKHPGQSMTPPQLHATIDAMKDSSFVRGDLSTDFLLFNELMFEEDWYYNPATNQFYKKVSAITFIHRTADTTDETFNTVRHETPVFTIRF